ncbi:DUF1534 domain-containing protein [Pseudomonas congelans]|nr:DUF1534 domain-containing protein [Pseudomonas congelans]
MARHVVGKHRSYRCRDSGQGAGDAFVIKRRALRRGRRASGTAYPRGAWARWCSAGRRSFLTLQRGDAVRGAPRQLSAQRRGAWAR